MNEIYKRIKARREELGYSQDELAQKMGYKNRSSIHKVEKGVNDIPQSKIIEFANALDVPPSYLMGWNDEDTSEKAHTLDLDSVINNGNEEYMLKLISKIIKQKRINMDLTEKYVSSKSGVNLDEYLDFEQNYTKIDLSKLDRIIETLGIEFYSLCGYLAGVSIGFETQDALEVEDEVKHIFKEAHIDRCVSHAAKIL